MLGPIRKALVAAVAVSAGAVGAPAVASAGLTWNTGATGTPGEASHGWAQLTITAGSLLRHMTCDVTVTSDLWNAADAGAVRGLGEITTFKAGENIGPEHSCTTELPGCRMAWTGNTTTPWEVTVDNGGAVKISGMSIIVSFSGASCFLNGASLYVAGSISGSMSAPGVLEFANATGLTTSLGPAAVDGVVDMLWEDSEEPVELS